MRLAPPGIVLASCWHILSAPARPPTSPVPDPLLVMKKVPVRAGCWADAWSTRTAVNGAIARTIKPRARDMSDLLNESAQLQVREHGTIFIAASDAQRFARRAEGREQLQADDAAYVAANGMDAQARLVHLD